MKKQLNASLMISLAAALFSASPMTQAASQEIAVMAWGTTWEQGLQVVADKFEKQTGIHVVPVTQSGSADGYARLQSMQDAPKIDIWFSTSSLAARVTPDKKLFAPIPDAALSNVSALIPGAKAPTWVAAYYYPLSIIYRPTLVTHPITAWADLWKPEFKDSLAVPDVQTYQARMLMVSALTHGGSIDNVDPGFTALKQLRPNIAMFYGSDSDSRRALAQGEVSVLIGPPSQAKPLSDAGVDVTVVSPKPAPVMFDVMTLVNTPKQAMALKFIDFVLSAESQSTISTLYNMGPVNHNVKAAPELAAVLPKESDQVSFDEAKINDHVAQWNERFNAEISR
ncbi:ABC transporter substrate-binding protein [Pseudomonas typographi]|uniref:Extracellular solute-binding protein n=1 Tax=Pseudomonas typographi TaxID=2715964 RepID=A0ABR7Z301_9PSED|nr:extracellular solute-binding protein [Pseudomonas typographi]MBD1586018.1 extracellular solute-binding protein [Pseudomonas typographi]MBD1599876.1 extracellular solute-binding protein [Pseudomonas typographi]